MRHSLAAILTATALALTLASCAPDIRSTASSVETTPATPTKEATKTSTTSQVAAEIAGLRPELQKSIDSYRDGRCVRIIESEVTGIDAVTCVASKIAIENYGKALVMELEMHEPWAPEIAALTEETRTRAKSMSATAGMDSNSAARMLDTEALFMTTILNKWDAYLS